jgi:TonB family protein
MMLLRPTIWSILLFVLVGVASFAEDVQKTADAMLDRARQLSDIRSPNAPGFRLNVAFSFIGRDLETLTGTYAEVWVSSSEWRRETIVGNFRRIEVGGPTRRWLLDNNDDFPEQAARVAEMLRVLPAKTAKFEFVSFAAPDPATQCAVTRALGTRKEKFAFCFDKSSGFLVVNTTPELSGERVVDYSCNYDQFQKFGDYDFPREMGCFMDGHRKIGAKVVGLSSEITADVASFAPPQGAIEMGNCSLNPVSPQLINGHPPFGMRDKKSSIVLWMIVDIKGKPQNVKIIRSNEKRFNDSALSAARGWQFKPGTCNGEPMPLPVRFEISSWAFR